MKLTLYSNFLNHHQLPFCKAMIELIGDGFTFVATEAIPSERIAMGYEDMNRKYPFVLRTYDGKTEYDKAIQLCVESDVIILGSAPNKFVDIRMMQNKLTFKYAERFFRKGLFHQLIPTTRKKIFDGYVKYTKNVESNFYVLCSSAYTAYDLSLCGMKNHTLKWGYFPEIKDQDLNYLMETKKKDVKKILCVGRLIDCKRTKDAIEIAKRLKDNGYYFSLDIIGIGSHKKKLQNLVNKYKLSDMVSFLGSMSPDNVRKHMEKSDIFLFTSNFQEGWGAVLNEAMNSGCAIVASHAVGSVPYLLKHEKNGLIYKYGDNNDFYNKVKYILDHPQKQIQFGLAAYQTINNTWNAKIAAERILYTSKQLLNGTCLNAYDDGPCTDAEIIKNNWFKEN